MVDCLDFIRSLEFEVNKGQNVTILQTFNNPIIFFFIKQNIFSYNIF